MKSRVFLGRTLKTPPFPLQWKIWHLFLKNTGKRRDETHADKSKTTFVEIKQEKKSEWNRQSRRFEQGIISRSGRTVHSTTRCESHQTGFSWLGATFFFQYIWLIKSADVTRTGPSRRSRAGCRPSKNDHHLIFVLVISFLRDEQNCGAIMTILWRQMTQTGIKSNLGQW